MKRAIDDTGSAIGPLIMITAAVLVIVAYLVTKSTFAPSPHTRVLVPLETGSSGGDAAVDRTVTYYVDGRNIVVPLRNDAPVLHTASR